MNKRGLCKAARKGFPYAEKMVNHIFRAINIALVNGETVTIYNFGQFYISRTKVTHVYDFKNRKLLPFKGRYKICFRPARRVEKILNEKLEGNSAGSAK